MKKFNIGLISCVKSKQQGKHKARDLYISDLFQKQLDYALQNCDKVFILSAKYGLLELGDEIESYEETLNNKSKTECSEWYYKVNKQLKEKVSLTDSVLVLAGEKYIAGLDIHNVTNPLSKLSFGNRLKWLKENTTSINLTNSLFDFED